MTPISKSPAVFSVHQLGPGSSEVLAAEGLDALCASARAGRLVVLCGAGVSREWPSLSPIVAPSPPLPGLLELVKEGVVEALPSILAARVSAALPAMGLEQFLENVAAVAGDDALGALDLLEAPGSRPNYRHLAIASLAALGGLRAIVTVNFDTFLEQALSDLGVAYVVPEEAANEAEAYRGVFGRGDRLPLFKLHGTLRNRVSLITTIETVGLGLPRYKAGAVRLAVEGSDLLVLGYSDNDVDVFREIEAGARGKVFWHLLTPPPAGRGDFARVGLFLMTRRHWVFSGSLDAMLEAVMERLDPAAAAAVLARLGAPDLAAVDAAEAQAVPGWSAALGLRSRANFGAWMTLPAAALIVRRSLPEDTAERAALRRDLLSLVEGMAAPGALVEIARCNQVAEEIANRGERREAIRMRRKLLARYGRSPERRLVAALLEEKIRLIRHEILQRWQQGWAIVHAAQVRRELGRRSEMPARDRERLRAMLEIRIPAGLHGLAQRCFAWEVRLRCGGRLLQPFATAPRRLRRWLARMAERRYRRIVDAEFGAGFRGLAMMRVAELLLLRRERWTPEVDELLAAARWRTRPSWQQQDEADEAQWLGIADGLRLIVLGAPKLAQAHLIRTFRYYAERGDISGRCQCLVYLAAAHADLGETARARGRLRAMARIRGRYR